MRDRRHLDTPSAGGLSRAPARRPSRGGPQARSTHRARHPRSRPPGQPRQPMGRNVRVLLSVSILFGVAGGIYEFVLPYYLAGRGLSFMNMGYVFAASTLAMFAVRLGLGNLADRWGSKRLYLLSVASVALACFATPFTAGLLLLIALKAMREVGVLARDTAHPILLYAEGRSRFADYIGKTRGMEFLFQALGTFAAGLGITLIGDRGTLWGAALALGAALLLLGLGVRAPHRAPAVRGAGMRQLLTFDLPRNLRVIMAANFVFSVGLSTSHCFIMPLFFSEKFGVSASAVSTVMVIHRLTAVLPLLLAGYLPVRHYRSLYIATMAFEGIAIAAGGLVPTFLGAAAVWLLHDLLGAGVWTPIQSAIIQDACREGSRGLDLSKTLAFSALGGAIGPILAGHLAGISISAPYVVSGLLVTASAGVLFSLRLAPKTEAAVQAAAG
ncbi:MAG: MFS transporter [Candidatus Latescibacterota bacterium]